VESDRCVARLVVARGVDQNKQRIEEDRRRFLEPDTVFAPVRIGLGRIPNENLTGQLEPDIHRRHSSVRIYFVNTITRSTRTHPAPALGLGRTFSPSTMCNDNDVTICYAARCFAQFRSHL